MMSNEINNRMRILIYFANTYDMPAEPGRDAMKGCSVHYFFVGNDGMAFKPVEDWNIDAPVGYQRGKVAMDYSMRAKIPVAPGIYDGDFAMAVGGDGKPVMKLVDVRLVAPFDISASFAQAMGLPLPGQESASALPLPEQENGAGAGAASGRPAKGVK